MLDQRYQIGNVSRPPFLKYCLMLTAVLAGIICDSPLQAQQQIQITAELDRLAISNRVEYYEDSSEALTSEQVLAP
jgi:hypothetical protein